jgi:hypothetical protein
LYPDFRLYRHGRCKIWLDSKYADPEFIALLQNPDALFDCPTCQIIKDQQKIKVARVVVDVQGEKHAIYVKRYNSFMLRHRLGSVFAPSGGVKSLRGAAILQRNNIATAQPIAAIEERIQGMVRRSFYLSKEISGGVTVDAYWLNVLSAARHREGFRRRRVFLHTLGALFRTLHKRGVYHNDLKDANILAVPPRDGDKASLYLLDLEGVRQYRALSESRRNKNLVQLNRTLGTHLDATEKLALVRAYLGHSYRDRQLRRHLISQIIDQSNRLNVLKSGQFRTPDPSSRT